MSIELFTYNILEQSGTTVDVTGTADTGFPESRLYDRSKGFLWKDTITEAKVFTVDQSANPLAVDTLFIDGHNFNGKAMQWQHSTDNFVSNVVDACTDWTQGNNNSIVKESSAGVLTRDYWRVDLASIANPYCAEIWMGCGFVINQATYEGFEFKKEGNVRWVKSLGGVDRAVKLGSRRRTYAYRLYFESLSDKQDFEDEMDNLDEYSLPFYIKDHFGEYWMCRLAADPKVTLAPGGNGYFVQIVVVEQEVA